MAAPPALVNAPPIRTVPSGAHATVSISPLVFGFHPLIRYGALAEKANALCRVIWADDVPFETRENEPTA